jgi:hypothetical protein
MLEVPFLMLLEVWLMPLEMPSDLLEVPFLTLLEVPFKVSVIWVALQFKVLVTWLDPLEVSLLLWLTPPTTLPPPFQLQPLT